MAKFQSLHNGCLDHRLHPGSAIEFYPAQFAVKEQVFLVTQLRGKTLLAAAVP